MKFACLSVYLPVCLPVCLSVCLSVCMSMALYAYNIIIVTLLRIYILSKSDLCLCLHTGRPESAETSHFDGGSCHRHIRNLLGA